MSEGLDRLIALLTLERIDRDLFRGRNPGAGVGRVFGGQVASQALLAASHTVEAEHRINSLHAYFLLGGRPGVPIVYSVDRIRDGRSFSTRRVVALQDGAAIFNLDASFHKDEPGYEFQLDAPLSGLPMPEDLHRDRAGWGRRAAMHRRPIDTRELPVKPRPTSTRSMWLRTEGRLPDDDALHAAVLTYMSDSGPIGAVRVKLAGTAQGANAAAAGRSARRPLMGASLDHTMWFHRPLRADEWLLYDLEAVAARGARGLSRGTMYSRDGHLAVTITQEALLRPLDGPR